MSGNTDFGFHKKNNFDYGDKIRLQAVSQQALYAGKINPNHVARVFQDANPVIYLNNDFYLYENGVYKSDNADNVIARIIKEQCGDNFSINLLREIKASLQASRAIDSKQVDICDNLLNLKNGVLDLKSFELLAHWDAYYSTRQLACEYIPESRCEKWVDFLNEILGDDTSKIDLLQEFFGYCLSRQTNQEKILWLHGRGANGKTVCTDVLEGLLGTENISGVSLEMFKNPNYVARLATSMVNISNESNSRSQVYESRIKELASGNLLTADHKYGHPFDFSNSCKLIFSFNTLPRLEDKTDATFRRLIIIQFNKHYLEHQQDKNLAEKLLVEKSGVLNWALAGFKRLNENGMFSKSQAAEALVNEYRKDNNHIASFVDDECMLDSFASVEKGRLYLKYLAYCSENNFKPFHKNNFGKELKAYYKQVEDGHGTGNIAIWKGIALS